ncbi:MAG: hypothetical protein JNM06_01935, partial [Blastocatellia bacterium]|nr:hypothetical protein [Blastocatellia bacterium]
MQDNTKNKVNGAIISSRLTFVEKRWGNAVKQKLINQLPLKDRKSVDSPVFDNIWFEFSTLELFDKIILEDFANGDSAVLRDLGRF